ncbi:MAG: response regulator receiver domain [Gemmatimonadota bacterium]|nr:response regulator receiver domain [Gemmatimonadota bacterium]
MTEVKQTAYDRFSIESAEQYIKTVVLVDDRIFVEGPRGTATLNARDPKPMGRKSASSRTESTRDTDASDKKDKEETDILRDASLREVQDSFAKKHIICSLYQPENDASFDDKSEVYGLCSSADVTIVDWDLGDTSGERALQLIGSLLEHSQATSPHQLRLLLIYTLEENLGEIATKISNRLDGLQLLNVDSQSEQLVIKTEYARVVVLGRPRRAPHPSTLNNRVPESELAERTIGEFSRLAAGLMQGIVLRGIAKLRDNNGRILSRFHKELDVAFLAHRALLLPEETFGQIIPLLTDELNSVLQDTLGDYPLGSVYRAKEIVDAWCEKNWQENEAAKLQVGVGADRLLFARDVFCNGPDLRYDYSKFRKSKVKGLIQQEAQGAPRWKDGKKERMMLADYLSGSGQTRHHNEKFGSLMSQRVKYGGSARTLHLGVIVRESGSNRRYLLCLQPLCDSVRTGDVYKPFVFSVLNECESTGEFTHCAIDPNGDVIRLEYNPKISSVLVSNFKSGEISVCAEKDETDRYIFKDERENRFEWIAELKAEHAQRAAEQFARELSRVGLTESEWLRLKAK